MSLLDEYSSLNEKQGFRIGFRRGFKQMQEVIIKNLLCAGHSPEVISRDTLTPLTRVNEVKNKYNL